MKKIGFEFSSMITSLSAEKCQFCNVSAYSEGPLPDRLQADIFKNEFGQIVCYCVDELEMLLIQCIWKAEGILKSHR